MVRFDLCFDTFPYCEVFDCFDSFKWYPVIDRWIMRRELIYFGDVFDNVAYPALPSFSSSLLAENKISYDNQSITIIGRTGQGQQVR